MKAVREIIEVDEEKCDGCGLCLLECHRGALLVEKGKAVVISDKLCDGVGHCLGACPHKALKIVRRAAERFNIKEYLEYDEEERGGEAEGCGLDSIVNYGNAADLTPPLNEGGTYRHWPIKLDQISAVPDGADILLCSDCAAAKTRNFHENYLKGHFLITVCPRLEETGVLATRLAAILENSKLRSLTCMHLDTDCCRSLPLIGTGAANIGGLHFRPHDIVIGLDGLEII